MNHAFTMTNFVYTPLDTARKEFRVIRFTRQPSEDQPIEIELEHRSLFEPGDYCPLSYVWGKSLDLETIVINGATREAPQSVVTLLKALWTAFPNGLPSKFWWADALCINQRDNDEKSSQVQMMGDIYGNGSKTYGYLGPAEDAHLADKLMHAICYEWGLKTLSIRSGQKYFLSHLNDLDPNHNNWMVRYPDFWLNNSEDTPPNRYWAPVMRLLNSPFWDRVWIYQEVLLSKECEIIYGTEYFNLASVFATNLFYTALFTRGSRDLAFTKLFHGDLWKSIRSPNHGDLQGIMRLESFFKGYHETEEALKHGLDWKFGLNRLLICNGLRATDARDRVFGLLGILRTGIKPQYEKSKREVYCEVVEFWVREIGDLNVLRSANPEHHTSIGPDPSLPSWVPDWSYFDRHPNVRDNPMLRDSDWTLYKASNGMPPMSVRFSSPWSDMFVLGTICDEVKEPLPQGEYYLLSLIEREIARSPTSPGTGLLTLQVICRTIVHDFCTYRGREITLDEMNPYW